MMSATETKPKERSEAMRGDLRKGCGLLAAALILGACALTGCPEGDNGLDCGTGEAASYDGEDYCVYRQELIIEGFSCPMGLARHDFEGFALCGGPPMLPPPARNHFQMQYGAWQVQEDMGHPGAIDAGKPQVDFGLPPGDDAGATDAGSPQLDAGSPADMGGAIDAGSAPFYHGTLREICAPNDAALLELVITTDVSFACGDDASALSDVISLGLADPAPTPLAAGTQLQVDTSGGASCTSANGVFACADVDDQADVVLHSVSSSEVEGAVEIQSGGMAVPYFFTVTRCAPRQSPCG